MKTWMILTAIITYLVFMIPFIPWINRKLKEARETQTYDPNEFNNLHEEIQN